jgi:hypothetical protein
MIRLKARLAGARFFVDIGQWTNGGGPCGGYVRLRSDGLDVSRRLVVAR